jgi:hypothetical protein
MKLKSAPAIILVLFALPLIGIGSASSPGFGIHQGRNSEQNHNHIL